MMLGLEENRLRVVAPEVGGGFGSKLNVYAEEALMGFVAMKIGKPVKWIESRRENFLCTIHGRGHVDYYEIAAKNDGTILGIKLQDHPGSGRVSSVADARDSHAQCADDAGPVSHPEHSRRHRRRLHQLRPHRRVSRRGPSRSHPRHRAHGRHARRRTEDGPGRNPPQELRPQRRISVPHRDRPHLRFGRLRRAARRRRWTWWITTSCARSKPKRASRAS